MTFFERVYQAVKQIPVGKVATYGQIACAIGAPRCARQVGFALHANPTPKVIPCHRIVNRFGALTVAFAFGGVETQAEFLREEGVQVRDDYTVDMQKYQYQGTFIVGE